MVFLCWAIPALHSSLSQRRWSLPSAPCQHTHTNLPLSLQAISTLAFTDNQLSSTFFCINTMWILACAHIHAHAHTHTLTPARVPISKPASTGIIRRQLPMKTIKKKKKTLCLPLCDYELWDHFHQLMPRRVVFFFFSLQGVDPFICSWKKPSHCSCSSCGLCQLGSPQLASFKCIHGSPAIMTLLERKMGRGKPRSQYVI